MEMRSGSPAICLVIMVTWTLGDVKRTFVHSDDSLITDPLVQPRLIEKHLILSQSQSRVLIIR